MASFHTPTKVLNVIDTRPKENEVKGAVQLDSDLLSAINRGEIGMLSDHPLTSATTHFPITTFAVFNKQDGELCDLLKSLCEQLNIPTSYADKFALRFEDGKFITNNNKCSIQQGFLLKLSFSPGHYTELICSELSRNNENNYDIQSALSLLIKLLADSAFVEIFNALGGTKTILELIENGSFETNLPALYQTFRALLMLMKQKELMGWHLITSQIIQRIAAYVNGRSKMESNDSLSLSLEIILEILENHSEADGAILSEIVFDSLIRHLENSDELILLSVLTLMNKLYKIADKEERYSIIKTLHSKPFILAINSVFKICQKESRTMNKCIRDQLYCIQQISLDELRPLTQRPAGVEEIEHVVKAYESTGNNEPLTDLAQMDYAEFKKVAQRAPPGTLSLIVFLGYINPTGQECIRPELFEEKFLRPSLWPLIIAHLTCSLASILGICSDPDRKDIRRSGREKSFDFFRVCLKYERPFYELFSVLVELFCRTCREMHANEEDLIKIVNIVTDQMERALATDPDSIEDLDRILQRKFSYFQMKKIWEREHIEDEHLELNNVAIQKLRVHIRSSIQDLVIQRRKNILKKGASFSRVDPKMITQPPMERQQRQSWRLDDKERNLTFCDYPNSSHSSSLCSWDANLTNKKIPISSIRGIIFGTDLTTYLIQHPSVKLSKKGAHSFLEHVFCIEVSTELSENIYLRSTDIKEFEQWTGGLQTLCFPEKVLQTPQVKSEVDHLTDIELRITMLDLPSDEIPLDELPIPELPTDISWVPKQFL